MEVHHGRASSLLGLPWSIIDLGGAEGFFGQGSHSGKFIRRRRSWKREGKLTYDLELSLGAAQGFATAMKRDIKLIQLFLRGYNESTGSSYEIGQHPDQIERQKPAIEAIAYDRAGKSLAIEHTLVQPFWGEKDDTQVFRTVFAPLESDLLLRLADYDIELWPSVGAIPRGVNWKEIGERVKGWFRNERDSFPTGSSVQKVPGLPFELIILVQKERQKEGRVFVGRSAMPDTLKRVIMKSLSEKLPKLVHTPADRRVLVLEKDNVPRGYVEIGQIIESVSHEFLDLAKVDEIWIVNTVAWEKEQVVFFYKIWPGGVSNRFKVEC